MWGLKVFDKGKDIHQLQSTKTIAIMKRPVFKILAWLNKMVLPSMAKKDLTRLSKAQKAVVAWRYWVTTNAL